MLELSFQLVTDTLLAFHVMSTQIPPCIWLHIFHRTSGSRQFQQHRQAHTYRSDQIRSVAQLCPTLCNPMNRSTPGFPVHHQLPQFTEISDSLLHHIFVSSRTHKSLHNIMPTKWNVSLPFQFSSVSRLCLTLCDPMDCSTPGFPVHHQLLEPAQTHVLLVGDAIQLSHLLPSPSPPAFNLS